MGLTFDNLPLSQFRGETLGTCGITPISPLWTTRYPLLINNYMDVLQTNPSSPLVTRNSVIFGDLKRYIVRRVKGLSVLRLEERFSDFGQVAFLGFARYDGTPAYAGAGNAFPFALLQNTY
jgi:hypothetical protein